MIIKKLHIISFGMLNDKKADIGKGLNVVMGDNETGKSTLGTTFFPGLKRL